jgi:two-component system, LytTR family, response regulator
MQIKAIIVDDEPHNIENLQMMLGKWCADIQIVGSASTADEAISIINRLHPDLVFLDIQMPGKSGFDVLKESVPIHFEVIFITAYDQYGIQAIKFSALDYLLKPVEVAELQLAVEKAKIKLTARQKNLNAENLIDFIKRSQHDIPKIALPTMQEIRYVKVNEIIRCEASNNYTTFHFNDGEKLLVCKTLKEFSELLAPYDFRRTHQSHLVNFHYVKSLLREDGGKLLLDSHEKIPISRQNMEAVKKALNGTS